MLGGRTDHILLLAVLILVAVGLVMILGASSFKASKPPFKDYLFFLKRQFLALLVGMIALILGLWLGYGRLKTLAVPILLVTIGLLAAVFIPPFGLEAYGARRWVRLGLVIFQPSELAKLGLVIYLAHTLSKKGAQIGHFFRGLLPRLLVLGIVATLILIEPNLSTVVIIALVSLVMLFLGGVKKWHLGLTFLLLICIVGVCIFIVPYRFDRIKALINPSAHQSDSGYSALQAQVALGSGGLFGLGLGMSKAKYLHLPAAHTDFIFAIIGEELGFLGTSAIVILFFIFAYKGTEIAIHTKDCFARLLAAGITLTITLQAIINISMVTGLVPVAGIPLPFISFGGSSLIISLFSIGLLLNIAQAERVGADSHASYNYGWGDRWARLPGHSHRQRAKTKAYSPGFIRGQ